MADTSVLEADAARREGSSPFPGILPSGISQAVFRGQEVIARDWAKG